MLGLNSLTIYASALALAVGLAAGWTVRDWRCDAAATNALIKADQERKKVEADRDRISQEYEEFRANIPGQAASVRTTVREIYRDKVIRPDCAADPVFARLLQTTSDRANAVASGQPGPTVRTSSEGSNPAH